MRGPWIAAGYHDDPRSPDSFTDDGWLRTGDIATIDRHGYLRLVDRAKDVIKSGGEWISSVALENEIMAHPGRRRGRRGRRGRRHLGRAAPRLRGGRGTGRRRPTKDELLAFLDRRVPKWWLPDDVVHLDPIPKTSVGKFDKKALRATLADRTVRAPTLGG